MTRTMMRNVSRGSKIGDLERIHFNRGHIRSSEVIRAFLRLEEFDDVADSLPESVDGSLSFGPKKRLELREGVSRVEGNAKKLVAVKGKSAKIKR
ncbi:hypothetical protein QA644_21400 (plasmid) [Rhizobium sp. CC1099]|uniref:hypothetical protein n=1 Tax=Rhizobium sp. CC1099 TaxID=3039160 RepID=UPI0024B10DCE|nr:hypothetical protein [Rhizobium sp. CC1099]WFU91964.1 hypothetical protein QA644_21400 [Rhizobium sp. CC1099]